MSEYQYYEFCRLSQPLSQEARKEMHSLSSRAKVTSHGASYVYNYGDFRGDPKKLLLSHFDVFFYIANWGTVRLMFKYPENAVNISELKKYAIEDTIECEKQGEIILLNIDLTNEESFGWTEGEGILSELLPLYEEIKTGNYQFLNLVSAIYQEWMDEKEDALEIFLSSTRLSGPQMAFLNIMGIEHKITA